MKTFLQNAEVPVLIMEKCNYQSLIKLTIFKMEVGFFQNSFLYFYLFDTLEVSIQ